MRAAVLSAIPGDEQLALPPQWWIVVEELLNFVIDAFEFTRKVSKRSLDRSCHRRRHHWSRAPMFFLHTHLDEAVLAAHEAL